MKGLLSALLLLFIYMLGVWSEILWFRSTDQDMNLWSIFQARLGPSLLCGAFAGIIACIATNNQSTGNRLLIVLGATLAGAITGMGVLELVALLGT